MAHEEKKGIVLARNSEVTPETKKPAKERRTETKTRKLHYVMKLPCFIETICLPRESHVYALLLPAYANYPRTILLSLR